MDRNPNENQSYYPGYDASPVAGGAVYGQSSSMLPYPGSNVSPNSRNQMDVGVVLQQIMNITTQSLDDAQARWGRRALPWW